MCAKVTQGRGKPETFYVVTHDDAFMLAPITPRGALNVPMKGKVFDYLLSHQQKVFTGIQGAALCNGAGYKPGMAAVDEFAIVNPCPGAQQPEPAAQH